MTPTDPVDPFHGDPDDPAQELAALDGDSEGGTLTGNDHAPRRLQSLLGDDSEQHG